MHRKATLALVSLLGGLVTACSSTVAGSPQSPSCAHGTDAAAVAPTIHCYARAVGRGDADTACSVLTAKAQRAVASSALKAGTVRCADAMRQAYAQLNGEELQRFKKIDSYVTISHVSLHGSEASATIDARYGSRSAQESVTLVAQGGSWRLDDDFGTSH